MTNPPNSLVFDFFLGIEDFFCLKLFLCILKLSHILRVKAIRDEIKQAQSIILNKTINYWWWFFIDRFSPSLFHSACLIPSVFAARALSTSSSFVIFSILHQTAITYVNIPSDEIKSQELSTTSMRRFVQHTTQGRSISCSLPLSLSSQCNCRYARQHFKCVGDTMCWREPLHKQENWLKISEKKHPCL